MAWRRPGDKSLSEPRMESLLTHICVTRPQWVKLRWLLLTLRCFNSLWPNDAIWQHNFGSIFFQVMAWSLRAIAWINDLSSMTYHQWGPSAFNWEQFYRHCLGITHYKLFENYIFENTTISHKNNDLMRTEIWSYLLLGDVIWRHGTRSTLAQVMACCLSAPRQYLNQCWLIICAVPWDSSQGIIVDDV